MTDFPGSGSPAACQDARCDFLRTAGIPVESFSPEAERANALYEAHSASSLDRELRDAAVSIAEAAQLLHKRRSWVIRLLASGQLMGVGLSNGQTMIPRWQFVDGKLLPTLRTVLAAFPRDYHALDIAQVMTSPAEDLGGSSPYEWLASGRAAAAVLALVSSLGYQ